MNQWRMIEWDNCPVCGNCPEVFTQSNEDSHVYDGEKAKCAECGLPGTGSADSGSVYIEWHDYSDCPCDVCNGLRITKLAAVTAERDELRERVNSQEGVVSSEGTADALVEAARERDRLQSAFHHLMNHLSEKGCLDACLIADGTHIACCVCGNVVAYNPAYDLTGPNVGPACGNCYQDERDGA